MGDMTLAEMRNELRYNIDNRESVDIANTTLDRWINWAYRHVSSPKVYRHPALQSTQNITLAANDRDYALNSDVEAIHSVYNQNEGYSLRREDIRWINERPVNYGGRPGVYARWNNTLFFHNGPSTSDAGKIIVVRYWAFPARLTTDNAITVLYPIWDEIIVMRAVWSAWRSLNRPDHAEIAKQDFSQMVNEVGQILSIEGEDWNTGARPNTAPYMPRS